MTWADILSEKFPEIEVINLGRSGGGNVFISSTITNAIHDYSIPTITNEKSDLFLIQWSSITRFDQYLNNGWITHGNILNQHYYSEEFVEKYIYDFYGMLQRDLIQIFLINGVLHHLNIDNHIYSMSSLLSVETRDPIDKFNITLSKHERGLVEKYKDTLDLLKVSMHQVLWDDNVPMTKPDPHPSPSEHARFLNVYCGVEVDDDSELYRKIVESDEFAMIYDFKIHGHATP
jgi:hypothetical protein